LVGSIGRSLHYFETEQLLAVLLNYKVIDVRKRSVLELLAQLLQGLFMFGLFYDRSNAVNRLLLVLHLLYRCGKLALSTRKEWFVHGVFVSQDGDGFCLGPVVLSVELQVLGLAFLLFFLKLVLQLCVNALALCITA
jgi:hypothetical protein